VLLRRGTRHAHRPGLHHGKLGLLAVKLQLENLLVHRVASLGGNLGDGAAGARGQQDLVYGDERVFVDGSPDIAAREVIANLGGGRKLPLGRAVEGRDVDAAGNVDAVNSLGDLFEGSLDTIVDVVEEAGTKLDREGLACPLHGVAHCDAGCWVSVRGPAKSGEAVSYRFPRTPGWSPGRR
jgi:hypothetical protein